MNLTSSAFENSKPIPRKYTGDGQDVSPPLSWSGAPERTAGCALVCDDPDAPQPDPWVHWVVYGIPADCASFPEGSCGGAKEGVNSGGGNGYMGPSPPQGHGVHHYYFRLYALDEDLDLQAGASREDLAEAMEGHVLAKTELVGTYER